MNAYLYTIVCTVVAFVLCLTSLPEWTLDEALDYSLPYAFVGLVIGGILDGVRAFIALQDRPPSHRSKP
jgi:hypothetical protein